MVIEIKCEEVWREISNYLEGDLSRELRARMEAHFRQCERCSAVLDGTRNVVRLVGDDRGFDVPPGFGHRLFGKLEAHLGKAAAGAARPVPTEIPLGVTEESIALGSHAVYFWETKQQFEDGVRFLEPGLRGRDRCIVFGHDSTNRSVVEALRKKGLEVERLTAQRQLVLLSRNAPAPVILANITAEFKAGVQAGAPAIRFLGTLVFGIEPWPGSDNDVLELEAKVTAAVQRFPSVVLCMYDVRTLPGRVLLKGGFQTHPLVLSSEGLRENPYYIPEERFLDALHRVQ